MFSRMDFSQVNELSLGSSVVTTGLTASYNTVKSSVFGDHLSRNVAGYGQYEFHKKRFDYSLGARLEYFQQDSLKPDSNFDFGDTTMSIPIYPIIRTAAHYKLTKSTHLRASFGQGVRVPSVSERYTSTSNGGIYIFPNPALRPVVTLCAVPQCFWKV